MTSDARVSLGGVGAVAAVLIVLVMLLPVSFGEGVDILPEGYWDGGGGGGVSLGGDSGALEAIAVSRRDGGDVWAERSGYSDPGVLLQGGWSRSLFEGKASDEQNGMPVPFEVEMLTDDLTFFDLRSDLKLGGELIVRDLNADDGRGFILQAHPRRGALLLIYAGPHVSGRDDASMDGLDLHRIVQLPRGEVPIDVLSDFARRVFGGAEQDVGFKLLAMGDRSRVHEASVRFFVDQPDEFWIHRDVR